MAANISVCSVTGGESMNGGTGSDTIVGVFSQPSSGAGQLSVINGNGGQDIIDIEGYSNGQMPPVAFEVRRGFGSGDRQREQWCGY